MEDLIITIRLGFACLSLTLAICTSVIAVVLKELKGNKK